MAPDLSTIHTRPDATGRPGAARSGSSGAAPRPGASIGDLLARTSRTFALSIPLLPVRLREQVTIAYLLFRIADTIEDELPWPAESKASLLRRLADVFTGDGTLSVEEIAQTIGELAVEHEGYTRLLHDASLVFGRFEGLPDAPREAITRHLVRTSRGMADELETGAAARGIGGTVGYCYTVAGIVGELCTELFVLHDGPLAPHAPRLMALAPSYGEGLQLVNILRDRGDDADAGRAFTPGEASHGTLFERARTGLRRAAEYTAALEAHGASPGVVAFNALNIVLAFETLALVAERGPGAKIGRARLSEILSEIAGRADRGEPITPVVTRASALAG